MTSYDGVLRPTNKNENDTAISDVPSARINCLLKPGPPHNINNNIDCISMEFRPPHQHKYTKVRNATVGTAQPSYECSWPNERTKMVNEKLLGWFRICDSGSLT